VLGGEFALLMAVAVGGVALGAAVAMGVIILRRSPARSLAGMRSDAPLAATQSAGDSVEDGDAPSETTRASAGMMQANSLSHQRGAPGGAAAGPVAVRVINPLSSPPIANRRKRSAAW
jgi:hypothetical protein